MHERERQRVILSVVQARSVATVQELSRLTEASEATIRRDIAALALKKKLKRVRGGAEAAALLLVGCTAPSPVDAPGAPPPPARQAFDPPTAFGPVGRSSAPASRSAR